MKWFFNIILAVVYKKNALNLFMMIQSNIKLINNIKNLKKIKDFIYLNLI